jgi:hypothetical protein
MRIMEEDSGAAIHSYLRIYQHPLTSGVDEGTSIGKNDFLRFLTALAQQRFVQLPGQVRQKHSNGVTRTVIHNSKARKASHLQWGLHGHHPFGALAGWRMSWSWRSSLRLPRELLPLCSGLLPLSSSV